MNSLQFNPDPQIYPSSKLFNSRFPVVLHNEGENTAKHSVRKTNNNIKSYSTKTEMRNKHPVTTTEEWVYCVMKVKDETSYSVVVVLFLRVWLNCASRCLNLVLFIVFLYY